MATAGVYATPVGGGRRRRPKTFAARRVCGTPQCETIISRYNAAEHCFRHAPPTFRRLRGVVTERD